MNQEPIPAEPDDDDFYAAARAAGMARADALKAQAAAGGLHFRAYLPPALATWLLNHIADGTFTDPSPITGTRLHAAARVRVDYPKDGGRHARG